jgi:uncharacterized protein YggT (Ycf19 family)
MAWVDLLLNYACLLLWLGWATARLDSLAKPVPSTLAGTLRRAGPSRARRWGVLVLVPAVLLVRAWFYWYVGPSLSWTPTVDLGPTLLPFRSDHFSRMLIYSALSFGKLVAGLYVWLLLLAVVNHRLRDTDSFQRIVHLLLWKLGRWHWSVHLLLGPALVALGWLALHPLLVWSQAVPAKITTARVLLQGACVWASLLLTAKYLLATVLVGHLIYSYVYLGSQAIWGFVSATASSFLRPLRWLPLRLGRFDAAPIVGLALIFLLTSLGEKWLAKLYPS